MSNHRQIMCHKNIRRPSFFCKAANKLIICAWIDTSNADTGSSHTISFGLQASALAIPKRWPLASAHLMGVAVAHVIVQFHQLQKLVDAGIKFRFGTLLAVTWMASFKIE